MSLFSPAQRNTTIAAVSICGFLLLFLLIPVLQVIYVAFQDPATGSLTLLNFMDFFASSLFRESFYNSLYVASDRKSVV